MNTPEHRAVHARGWCGVDSGAIACAWVRAATTGSDLEAKECSDPKPPRGDAAAAGEGAGLDGDGATVCTPTRYTLPPFLCFGRLKTHCRYLSMRKVPLRCFLMPSCTKASIGPTIPHNENEDWKAPRPCDAPVHGFFKHARDVARNSWRGFEDEEMMREQCKGDGRRRGHTSQGSGGHRTASNTLLTSPDSAHPLGVPALRHHSCGKGPAHSELRSVNSSCLERSLDTHICLSPRC